MQIASCSAPVWQAAIVVGLVIGIAADVQVSSSLAPGRSLSTRAADATLPPEVVVRTVTPETAEDVRELIARTCAADARIELAYLFGSAAQGPLETAADIDVAIGFGLPNDALDRLGLLGETEDRLVAALQRPVDVIDLFRAPPILVHQILDGGRPAAFVRDERRWLEFENGARKTYFEMKRRYAIYDQEAAR